ncbi:hypothetical protein COLO4_33398 [Corchorus olitorius]|uniref:Uncharacterized protein n=1 Tax=Corchorus olitorius TaxID=93759 RepID=A0A1R3GUA4_9ROSI|nr:hypothetical protein COLO4_33398 [Corchorus olitorius]
MPSPLLLNGSHLTAKATISVHSLLKPCEGHWKAATMVATGPIEFKPVL